MKTRFVKILLALSVVALSSSIGFLVSCGGGGGNSDDDDFADDDLSDDDAFDDDTSNDDDASDDDASDDDDSFGSAPTVIATTPGDSASDVALNAFMIVAFSEAMDPLSISSTTFTLYDGATPVPGTVTAGSVTALFAPTNILDPDTLYSATITSGVTDLSGHSLDEDYEWNFTTGTTLDSGPSVNLGSAGDFAILAKSGISTVPTSAVTGNMGVSPVAATYITGFSLTMDSTNVFSTSSQVTGRVYAADYAPPTPSNMTRAIGDMEIAYTDASARAPDVTELGAGNIGGMTLAPGVYKWGTGLLIPTDVTLSGSATDVWIFQIAENLTVSSAANVFLTGGAVPENVFWQVAGLADINTTAHAEGVILTQTAITLRTGASINGRLLAQTAVNIDSSTVVEQPAQ